MNKIQPTQDEIIKNLTEENTRLRAALAFSDRPCPYCTLSKEDWAKCKAGFPGCDRLDDAAGCPELGAMMQLEQFKQELDVHLDFMDDARKEGSFDYLDRTYQKMKEMIRGYTGQAPSSSNEVHPEASAIPESL